ncbi:MAG: ROK family protein [Microbacteriaceae bacterium]
MSRPDWNPLSPPERRVAVELLIRGPESRVALARSLDLSAASLTRLTKPLLDSGVLADLGTGAHDGNRGRPTQQLDVVAEPFRFVGVKLTGDRVYLVLTDLRARILDSREASLGSTEPEAVADQIVALVDGLRGGHRAIAVGVAVSGKVVASSDVTYSEFLHWSDVPLGALLRARASWPVVVTNDVAACTLAESWFGAGRSHASFGLITVGAGVGYGLVVDGRAILDENTGITLVGHLPLDGGGPLCPLGHQGCAHAMLTSASIVSTVSAALGRMVSYEECLSLAEGRDPVAYRVVTASARALGRLAATIANVAMVRTIQVIGDGVGLAQTYRAEMLDELAANRDPRASAVTVDVRPSTFIDWAQGAAAAAIQAYALADWG